jgi:uncharacterized NAD(P)/FAD-binding protein YdhS
MVFGNILKKISTQKSQAKIKFIIFEKDGEKAVGAGFSNFSDNYILNVPAKKMSPFQDIPDDFVNFLKENYPEVYKNNGPDGFIARNIYGQYLKKLSTDFFKLADDLKIDYELIQKTVIDIDQGFKIYTENLIFDADEIILSSSFVQSKLNYCLKDEKLISPLWSKNSIDFHQKNNFKIDDKICIIGTGLSAIDVLVGLNAKNFTGKIYAISRRGNFPKPHFIQQNSIPNQEIINFIEDLDIKTGLINISLKFRKYLKNNKDYDLRHLIDSIRGKTKFLWQNLDEKNKIVFLKKLLPYWNIFRHRVPSSSLEIINKMIKNNQLEVIKSSVKSIEKCDGKFVIKTTNKTIDCDYVVNCLGFDYNIKNYPLIDSMLNKNLLKKDLILAQSNNSKIHLVGGLNIGRDFENTAVPDLRVDANLVAEKIVANILV